MLQRTQQSLLLQLCYLPYNHPIVCYMAIYLTIIIDMYILSHLSSSYHLPLLLTVIEHASVYSLNIYGIYTYIADSDLFIILDDLMLMIRISFLY